MKRRHRRMLFAGVLMLAAGPSALALRPGRVQPGVPAVKLETVLPLTFGGWHVDPRMSRSAAFNGSPSHIINRVYVNKRGGSVALTVSYGGKANDALEGRRPEEVLAAEGVPVREIRRDRLHLGSRSVPVTRLTAIRGTHTEPMTYWITVGERVVRTRGEWLSAQLLQGLAGRTVEGLQFRISTSAEDLPGAFAEHDHFIATLLAEVPAAGLARLLGWRTS